MHRQGHTNKDGQYPNTLNAVCNLRVDKKITFNCFGLRFVCINIFYAAQTTNRIKMKIKKIKCKSKSSTRKKKMKK